MENNNYQQPQYQQPQAPYRYQSIDPNYASIVKDFLTKAIVSCAISCLPVGSIIALNMATKNRKALLEYLDKGGIHTQKIKVCSALSRAGRYAGIAYTIIWGLYLLYILFWLAAMVIFLFTQASQF